MGHFGKSSLPKKTFKRGETIPPLFNHTTSMTNTAFDVAKSAFEHAQETANLNFDNFMQEQSAARDLDYKVSEAIWLLKVTDPHIAEHLNDALGTFRNNKVKSAL